MKESGVITLVSNLLPFCQFDIILNFELHSFGFDLEHLFLPQRTPRSRRKELEKNSVLSVFSSVAGGVKQVYYMHFVRTTDHPIIHLNNYEIKGD